MGLPVVRELTQGSQLVEVLLPGRHVEALMNISKGQAALDMGLTLDEFLG